MSFQRLEPQAWGDSDAKGLVFDLGIPFFSRCPWLFTVVLYMTVSQVKTYIGASGEIDKEDKSCKMVPSSVP